MTSICKTRGFFPGLSVSWQYAKTSLGFDAVGIEQQIQIPKIAVLSRFLSRAQHLKQHRMLVSPETPTYTRFQYFLKDFGPQPYLRKADIPSRGYSTYGRLYRWCTAEIDETTYHVLRAGNKRRGVSKPKALYWQWTLEESLKPGSPCSTRDIVALSENEAEYTLRTQGIIRIPIVNWWLPFAWTHWGGPPTADNPDTPATDAVLANIERFRQVWNLQGQVKFQLVLDTLRPACSEYNNGFYHEVAYIRLWSTFGSGSTLHEELESAMTHVEKLLERFHTQFKPVTYDEDQLATYLEWKARAPVRGLEGKSLNDFQKRWLRKVQKSTVEVASGL